MDASDADVAEIGAITRGQSRNKRWLEKRSTRITASHFYAVCNVKDENAKKNMARNLINPQTFWSDAILYEKTAVEQYLKLYDGTVRAEESGLFIIKDYPYLAASPDGLIGDSILLEVKCPYTARHTAINPYTVP